MSVFENGKMARDYTVNLRDGQHISEWIFRKEIAGGFLWDTDCL